MIETRTTKTESCVTVIAVDQDQTVGRVFMVAPTHVEGIWIDPNYRNAHVMKRLVDRVEDEARLLKISRVFAYATDETMESYIERLGYTKLDWTVWQKDL